MQKCIFLYFCNQLQFLKPISINDEKVFSFIFEVTKLPPE